MKIAAIVINKEGEKLAKKLKAGFKGLKIVRSDKKGSLREIVTKVFRDYEGIIFCAALGIVARFIGPFIKSKYTDPAVVCVDTAGRFAVSVLSGHEGGANQLAYKVAAIINAEPVITTGTEVHRRFTIGVGCRRGTSKQKIKKAVNLVLKTNGINRNQVRLIATIDLKKDEEGLIQACNDMELPVVFISRKEINRFKGDISISQVAERNIGVPGVCEPCALIAGRRAKLVSPKQVIDGVTVAVAKEG